MNYEKWDAMRSRILKKFIDMEKQFLDLEKVSGLSVDKIYELFLAGYTLQPPKNYGLSMASLTHVNEHEVTVRAFLVCECGYIFYDGIEYREEPQTLFYEKKDFPTINRHFFEPSRCPNCNKAITTIEVPNELLKK